MSHEELRALLTRSRAIHERYLFEADSGDLRDDVAEICMAIDDILSSDPAAPVESAPRTLARTAA